MQPCSFCVFCGACMITFGSYLQLNLADVYCAFNAFRVVAGWRWGYMCMRVCMCICYFGEVGLRKNLSSLLRFHNFLILCRLVEKRREHTLVHTSGD